MRSLLAGAVLALGLAVAAGPGHAQQAPPPTGPQTGVTAQVNVTNQKPFYGSIAVNKGAGTLVKLPHPVSNIFAADPAVVSVRPASPDRLFIFGKGTGETTIVATDAAGNIIAQYTVIVGASNFTNDRLASQAQISAPGSSVHVEAEPGGVVVSGTVDTPQQANDVMNQAKLITPGVAVNDLQVREPIQVELKVRIASMSRNVTRQLGIDWTSLGSAVGKFTVAVSSASAPGAISGASPGGVSALFPGGTFEGVIDALAQDNLAHVLAEPTLTTVSGTQASFQVGGQFPVPVSSTQNVVSVEFKSYGVLLTFTPTVFSDGRISLQVAPQISTISSANSALLTSTGSNVTLAVPSISITSASSTVILGSGQGMAIAGLLEDTSNQVNNGVPGLSEVPLIGALFRGDSFQRQQQELVITVTPYLVSPVKDPGALASPDDGWSAPNDLQRILLLRDNGANTANAAIPGDAGFLVQ